MVAPKITAADLITLRDSGDAAVGLEMAVRGDPIAQLALLESRLLALALSMPRGLDAKDLTVLAADEPFFDSDTLSAYLRGELVDESLARFEADVRGHPARFAELVAFKNAYFGRKSVTAASSSRMAPRLERMELGVLTMRPFGNQAALEWNGRRDVFRPIKDSALVSPFQSSEGLMLERELNDLREQMAEIERTIESRMLMARKLEDMESLAEIAPMLALLEQMSTRQRELVGRWRDHVEETLSQYRRLAAQITVDLVVEGHHLRFSSRDQSVGALTLYIHASSEACEFTWVRPGIDFKLLTQDKRGMHRLGPIRDEAQLLIDAPGKATQIIRVRVE